MVSEKYPKQIRFSMAFNDYVALKKFLIEEERTMGGFLRFAIKKELNSDSAPDISQILTLGHCIKCNRSVSFNMRDNDFHALQEYLKNAGLGKATFYRYILKKELHRLEIEKEKNQSWDLG